MATTYYKTAYLPFILFAIIVGLSVFLFSSQSNLKRERQEREYEKKQEIQNDQAMIDSIRVVFNKKLDAWEYSKDNFLLTKIEDLENYNKKLAEEVKKIKGDVISVIDSKVQGDLGGISTANGLAVLDNKNNYYGLAFKNHYKDSTFEQNLEGISKFYVIPNEKDKTWNIKPDATIFDVNMTKLNITYGFRETKDKYEVFAISKSDKIRINDLTGGIVINKPTPPKLKAKKWGVGPYIGYGLNINNDKTVGFGASLGFSIHYSIFEW